MTIKVIPFLKAKDSWQLYKNSSIPSLMGLMNRTVYMDVIEANLPGAITIN